MQLLQVLFCLEVRILSMQFTELLVPTETTQHSLDDSHVADKGAHGGAREAFAFPPSMEVNARVVGTTIMMMRAATVAETARTPLVESLEPAVLSAHFGATPV